MSNSIEQEFADSERQLEERSAEARSAAEAEMANAVYAASVEIFERLESQGRIRGNGHHAAQKVSDFARDQITDRWQLVE